MGFTNVSKEKRIVKKILLIFLIIGQMIGNKIQIFTNTFLISYSIYNYPFKIVLEFKIAEK